MKCLIDPDLLFPPPVPGAMRFVEMAVHTQQLARFGLKVSISPELMAMLWTQWRKVQNRNHKQFLVQILTRHLAANFPENVVLQKDQVVLVPDFLSEVGDEQRHIEWLRSMIACYSETHFNADGAILATWDCPIFEGRQCVEFTYLQIRENIPLKRNKTDWDVIAAGFRSPPISYNGALRVYADESGTKGSHEWVAFVVMTEADANHIVSQVIEDFNKTLRVGKAPLHEMHISKYLGTEKERFFVVKHIVDAICKTVVACFIALRRPGEGENVLYARGVSAVLCQWQRAIAPVYIDTPYDRANDDRHNIDLRQRVHNAIQAKGKNYRFDDIILGKSPDYPGLAIADVLAYLYLRKNDDQEWHCLWEDFETKHIVTIVK